MSTTHRRSKTERRAHRCAICLPATDDTIDGGTDHRTKQHDEACDE